MILDAILTRSECHARESRKFLRRHWLTAQMANYLTFVRRMSRVVKRVVPKRKGEHTAVASPNRCLKLVLETRIQCECTAGSTIPQRTIFMQKCVL